MEERMIDNEREIKIKRKRGGIDAQDALAEDTDEADEAEEFVLDLPDGEYDEDLVGLTPAQLQEKLARREKEKQIAKEAQENLMREGAEKLAAKEYAEAEIFYSQALVYGENSEAARCLWRARTKDFTETDAFYVSENASEFAAASQEVRAYVLEQSGEQLKREREEYRKEAEPLGVQVKAAIEERRGPFLANKAYYSLRFRICLGAFVLSLIWIIASVSTVYSTEGMLSVYLAIAGGVLALVCLGLTVIFSRKLFMAKRLCEENEKLSSTEEGARLEFLNGRLECLKMIFGE